MTEQELLTDLAVAERNMQSKLKFRRFYFRDEVRNVFSKTKVRTYFDLVQTDLDMAIQLRDLAVKLQLLKKNKMLQ